MSIYLHYRNFSFYSSSILAVGRQPVNCSPQELVTLNPPSGETCIGYMQTYINAAGGYLTNPNATSNCQFCSAKNTDEFLLLSFNIDYGNRWRDTGIILGVTLFNVGFSPNITLNFY